MPTTPPEQGRGRRLLRGATRLVAVLVSTGLVAAGCGDSDDPGPRSSHADPVTDAERTAVEGVDVPPDLARMFTRLLDRRADAVLTGDRRSYLATLGPDAGLRTAQAGYFDNLRQLPLESFGYTLDRGSLVRNGDSYWVVVDVGMRLRGYDASATHVLDRVRFGRQPGGGYRITSLTDTAWEQSHGVEQQPWDLEPVSVLEGLGVLGVFDAGSQRLAGKVVHEVEDAVADVRGVVPYADWNGDIVVYALSSPTFLDRLPKVPGGDPGTIDGLTFTLPVSADDQTTAAVRVYLGASVLASPPGQRERLIRHELAHVAMAGHDVHAPLWLAEGLAEYVSVQPLAPAERRVDAGALRAAEQGRLVALPDDEHFNDAQVAQVDYALSWWACEWIAAQYGPSTLWSLLDELDAAGAQGLSDAEMGDRVEALIGVTRSRLAREAAALLVHTYRPPDPDEDDPDVDTAPTSDAPTTPRVGP